MKAKLEAVDLPAPELTLEGPEGPVDMASLWKAGPLVMVFLRHFG